ncbi:cupin domain-containing protein [Emticicia sp. C21]|uniref:cupin domain-containing protein n=1 Tax=Emticicia sp. C21 TaxID=2302915 RepID=UPI000E344711|nr:cupin domain-containing protein [Emticicia sp. C21]RFS15224.1 cupin domain-containing protein [Emticicia sp. C21]
MKSNIKIIKENNGKHFSVVGDTYRTIISGKQTNGEYAIIDMLVPLDGGPPPHAHASFHESFYIVDGELEFKTEDGKYIARKGDLVNIPKGGAIHSFKNTSKAMAHLLCTVVPAGLDDFFEEIGTPVEEGEFLPPHHLSEEEIKKVVAIAGKYGQVLYPPDYLDK